MALVAGVMLGLLLSQWFSGPRYRISDVLVEELMRRATEEGFEITAPRARKLLADAMDGAYHHWLAEDRHRRLPRVAELTQEVWDARRGILAVWEEWCQEEEQELPSVPPDTEPLRLAPTRLLTMKDDPLRWQV